MRTRVVATLLTAALWVTVADAESAEHHISQQNNSFGAEQITVHVGDSVVFANDDKSFHSVFSVSRREQLRPGHVRQGPVQEGGLRRAGRRDRGVAPSIRS